MNQEGTSDEWEDEISVLEVRLLLAGDDRTHVEYAVRITVPLDTADRVPSDNKRVAGSGRFRGLRPNRPYCWRSMGARFRSGKWLSLEAKCSGPVRKPLSVLGNGASSSAIGWNL